MSTDDFKPLTPREQALVAGWTAEVDRLREALTEVDILARHWSIPDGISARMDVAEIAREALEAGER